MDHINLLKEAQFAMKEMMAEFRALDLPYGSKAYTAANDVVHKIDAIMALPSNMEELLRSQRDVAIGMLADWAVAVDENGTGWDDWDEYYKDALYRPCPIRDLLDSAIAESRAQNNLLE